MSVESIPEDEEEAETSTSTNSEKVGQITLVWCRLLSAYEKQPKATGGSQHILTAEVYGSLQSIPYLSNIQCREVWVSVFQFLPGDFYQNPFNL